jgi:DNA-binding XRE family transcriptional regulator
MVLTRGECTPDNDSGVSSPSGACPGAGRAYLPGDTTEEVVLTGIFRFDPERLVELRKKAGLSREQLAILVGRGYQSIAFYERGEQVPPTAVVGRLAALLGVEPSALFTEESVGASA